MRSKLRCGETEIWILNGREEVRLSGFLFDRNLEIC